MYMGRTEALFANCFWIFGRLVASLGLGKERNTIIVYIVMV